MKKSKEMYELNVTSEQSNRYSGKYRSIKQSSDAHDLLHRFFSPSSSPTYTYTNTNAVFIT